MSSNDDDDFGDLDDEDMILVATQAEERNGESEQDFPIDRLSKRRRLNEIAGEHERALTGDRSKLDSSATIRCSAESYSAEGQEPGTPQNKQRSKHKIHIPKQAEDPKDVFYTQLPRSSPSPYRIRGSYWQKPQPKPPTSPKFAESLSKQQENSILTLTNSMKFPSISYKVDSPTKGHSTTSHPISHRGSSFSKNLIQNPEDQQTNVIDEFLDLPSDAFSSSLPVQGTPCEPTEVSAEYQSTHQWPSQPSRPPRLVGPQANLRQTTLFGGSTQGAGSQSQSTRRHNWPLTNRQEAPTHHKLDEDALGTWVYPTNLGTLRDYQYNIASCGLYSNLLVALPTGLGKTFIAATIMLNWFRWTNDAQIVFVAPTKPLVSQQVEACFTIAGIPRSATTMLTGNTPPGIRAEEWQDKRVFFMTPQTIINDLKTGICDPKRIVLIVVDEAHRATGNYAYVEVVRFLRRFNTSFRVLALTATPGSSVESVQEVIDGLGISRVEIRTEESMDIRQYVHARKVNTIMFEESEEMIMVMDLFAEALQPVLSKLNGMNAYWSRDPRTLTAFGCMQARQRWMASDAGRNASHPIKGMVNTIFSLLASLAHSIELLKFHGIGPFFHKVTEFRNDTASGEKSSKYRKQINESGPFQKMMSTVKAWVSNDDFIGHPKLEYLRSVVLNHFLDAGDGKGTAGGVSPASTRIMVFVHYRDSAEEVARVLKRNEPMIRPHVFVGQANSKGSEGMDQKKQLDIIQKFKNGIYNTLVATSIGEEGLDIGQVDLIVCYDASASPIRMLQRMGRTGRKRAGNIVVTLMKGKEETNFMHAKDSYEKMQQMIAAGTRFTFHDDLSPRIVPREIKPVVDKRIVDIPPENTQPDLPEPKKRAKAPKRPPKKFHMPDGVRKGFTSASRLEHEDEGIELETENMRQLSQKRESTPESIPTLDSVLLTASEEKELERSYLDVGGDAPQIVQVPRLDTFPELQRSLRSCKRVKHGRATKRVVNMLNAMHSMTEATAQQFSKNLRLEDRRECEAQAKKREVFFSGMASSVHLRAQTEDESIEERTPVQMTSTKHKSPSRPRPHLRQPPRESATSIDLAVTDNEEEMEDDPGDDMDGFINDDDGNDDITVASSASSPPLLATVRNSFYEPMKVSLDDGLDTDEDLPDLGTLVRKASLPTANVLSERDNINEIPRPSQRKGRRRVVESDSEDDFD